MQKHPLPRIKFGITLDKPHSPLLLTGTSVRWQRPPRPTLAVIQNETHLRSPRFGH